MISRPAPQPHAETLHRLQSGESRFRVVDETGEQIGYVVSLLVSDSAESEEPVVVDASARADWERDQSLEFRAGDGKVVGRFIRHGQFERDAEAAAMKFFTDEMLDEASQSGGGRPLADILRDLDVA